MRISRGGLYSVCAVFCICAYPVPAWANDAYDGERQFDDLETMTRDRVFEDVPRDESSETVKTDFEEFERKLIPIKSPKATRNNFAVPLEPDAEMLPAHYTGVKPPGVDHMELKHAESRILGSSPNAKPSVTIEVAPIKSKKSVDGDGGRHGSSEYATESGETKGGREKVDTVEKGSKGELEKEKKGSEYFEGAGKKGTRSESDSSVKHGQNEGKGQKGSVYDVKDNYGKDRSASGYRNVYHKDEYNRDADFYDNDHHGGHFAKHVNYNEKHTALEAGHKKGASNDSGVNQAEVTKKGTSGKTQVNEEAEGHDARQGYDGFFKNFQGFAKHSGKADRKLGFVDGKVK